MDHRFAEKLPGAGLPFNLTPLDFGGDTHAGQSADESRSLSALLA
jgi:hypothetical protein